MENQRKIEALKNMARSGTKYEAETAREILARMDIDLQKEEPIELFVLTWETEYEWTILRQTIAMILDTRDIPIFVGGKNGHRVNSKRFIKCTKSQFLELELFYGLYKRALNSELDITVRAFIQKNGIFPDSPAPQEGDEEITEEIKKIIRRADSVDRVHIRKQITNA